MRKSTNKFEIVGDILKITTASGTLILAVDKNKYKPFRLIWKGFCYLLLIERSIFVHFYKVIPSERKTLSKRLTLCSMGSIIQSKEQTKARKERTV